MIQGIGTDICDIRRIRASFERHGERFAQKILCEAELAVWRSASGRIAAWRDRCPHRGMRLSHGFVRGESLNCIYHGWTYGADGACRRIPAHPEVVPPATIRADATSR